MQKIIEQSVRDDSSSIVSEKKTPSVIGPLLSTALPASLGAFIGFSQDTINLIYVGTLGDPKALAAIGLGNLFVTMLGIAVFYGFNGALETLVS